MKNGFFYEPNCVENGEWIPEKKTLEDMLVLDLRFLWSHRYNLELRYSQQCLRSAAARWRFKGICPRPPPKSGKLVSTEPRKTHGYCFAVKWLLTTSWAEDPSHFRNAKTWESNLQA